MLRERERRKTLILIHVINNLQLRSIYIYTSLGELTTIHVTYIKKGKTVHYIYIIFNTPPQAEAYMSYAPSLLQMYLILVPLRDLVKMSAS